MKKLIEQYDKLQIKYGSANLNSVYGLIEWIKLEKKQKLGNGESEG